MWIVGRSVRWNMVPVWNKVFCYTLEYGPCVEREQLDYVKVLTFIYIYIHLNMYI